MGVVSFTWFVEEWDTPQLRFHILPIPVREGGAKVVRLFVCKSMGGGRLFVCNLMVRRPSLHPCRVAAGPTRSRTVW